MSAPPTLQEAIDKAGSPIRLLWKPNAKHWTVPVIAPEYAGWREEQAAWREGVVIMDLSHHMSDTFIEGPDATKLLTDVAANDFENFEIGQAKQIVPVTEEGFIVTDGILFREEENKYTLSGVPASQSWVKYHAKRGNYKVTCVTDPDSGLRKGGDPVLYRYQIQGPKALALVEKIFGGPLPKMKFFHSKLVDLAGKKIRAFRHGMAGQAGYEFIGPYAEGAEIKKIFMDVGEEFGLVHVGGMAYYTNGIESGWVPTPNPGIYTPAELEDYRKSLSVFSYEGQKPLHGSFFSENIEDYYVSPYELGYGKMIAFNHDFIGRAALEKAKDNIKRTKVTLICNDDDVGAFFGEDHGYILSYGRYRIEHQGKVIGLTFYSGFIDPLKKLLCLSLVDSEFAAPGTEVEVVWGEHPGPGTPTDSDLGLPRLRATVEASPYNQHAREVYRKN